jgi:hypothetical protein
MAVCDSSDFGCHERGASAMGAGVSVGERGVLSLLLTALAHATASDEGTLAVLSLQVRPQPLAALCTQLAAHRLSHTSLGRGRVWCDHTQSPGVIARKPGTCCLSQAGLRCTRASERVTRNAAGWMGGARVRTGPRRC